MTCLTVKEQKVMRSFVMLGSIVTLLALGSPAVQADDRAAMQHTIQITSGNAPSAAPVVSGDERYDRLLAFQSDAGDLTVDDTNGHTDIFVVHNANPDATASQPWTPTGMTLISRGLDGAPANGDSYGPSVDGHAGEPPVAPTCVAFVSNASNLVKGDTNGQPDAFVASLSTGKITRVSLDSKGLQLDAPTFDASVDGTCANVAFTTSASRLGHGRHLYIRTVTGKETTASASPGHPGASDPSYASRRNMVAYAAGGAVYVRDVARGKTVASIGDASKPALSEQGSYVAYEREGTVWAGTIGTPSALSDWVPSYGSGKQVSQGLAAEPSIGCGGAYVGYSSPSGVSMYTDVRGLNLLESVDESSQPLAPANDPTVSSRGNEVFFVHSGQIYARYLGGR